MSDEPQVPKLAVIEFAVEKVQSVLDDGAF
jgi:hypothetical protein